MNKTQLFAKSEKELCSYLPAYKTILSATAWVNPKTGEAKRFSAEQKLVWHYVLDRYKFFKDSNKDYFDNQADIAIACDVSERTVIRLFKDLSIAGYLQIHQIRVGGHKSNSYKITKDLVLVQRENTAFKASVSPQVERSEETDTNTQPNVYVESDAAGEAWLSETIPDYDYDYDYSNTEKWSDSYQAPVEQIQYRTEPDRDPWDDVDEEDFESITAMADSNQQPKVEAPAKQNKIIFETVAQFISTNFKHLDTTEAMDVLEANGVKDADNVLKGRGGCKILGEWFIYDSKQGYFTSDECPF